MGYRTYHSLFIYKEKEDGTLTDYLENETHEHELLISKKYCDNDYDEPILFQDEWKWYECEENMKEYSSLYPDLVFCIHGEGEETGDLWDAYFKNGKMQFCDVEITYPPYNKQLLK